MRVFNKFGASWLIFFLLCSVYFLTTQGYIQSTDGVSIYLMTRSIAEGESLHNGQEQRGLGKKGPDGEYYSKFGIGFSLISLPLYYLGKLSSPFLQMEEEFVTVFFCSLLNIFIVALTGALIFQLGILLGIEKCVSIVLSLVYGLGSMAWFYSSTFYNQPLVALLIVLALIFSIKWWSVWYGPLLAGFCLGYAVITRYETVILWPVFLLYIVFMNIERKRGIRNTMWSVLLISLPYLLFLGLSFEYNYLRYGSYINTGYKLEHLFAGSILDRLFHHFLSPGKGFFLYNPLFLFSIPGFYLFYKKKKEESLLCILILILYVSVYLKCRGWSAFAFSIRYLIPVIPLFVIPLGFFIDRFKNEKWVRRILLFLFIISVFIEIAGLTVSPSRHYYKTRIKYGQENLAPVMAYSFKEGLLIGQIFGMVEVLGNITERDKLKEMTSLALERKSFLSEDDRYILKYGLTLNVPNFWWFYLYLYGFPPVIILFIIIVLILIMIVCSFRLYRWTTNR